VHRGSVSKDMSLTNGLPPKSLPHPTSLIPMKSLLATIALTIVLAAHFSRQAPVRSSHKGKEVAIDKSRRTASTRPSDRFNPTQMVSQDDSIHPTLKAHAALTKKGYSAQFYKDRINLFKTDPFFKALEDVPAEEYAAGFDKLRPAQDQKRGRENSSLNNSISALMTAHMNHLDKSQQFQALVKGKRARHITLLSNKVSNRRKRERKPALSNTPVVPCRRDPKTVQKNAAQFTKDMQTYGINWSDDPIKFEENTRPLMEVHGKHQFSRKLTDYMLARGATVDFVDHVRGQRTRHIHELNDKETYLRKKKLKSQRTLAIASPSAMHDEYPPASSYLQQQQSVPITSTSKVDVGASSYSLGQQEQQVAPIPSHSKTLVEQTLLHPGREHLSRTTPGSPTFAEAIHELSLHPSDDNANSQHHSDSSAHNSAGLRQQHEAPISSRHAVDHANWMKNDEWWKALLD
jgi:hypothetical protein